MHRQAFVSSSSVLNNDLEIMLINKQIIGKGAPP